MSIKINVSALSGAQLVALFQHFMALDQARLAGQNFLLASLVNHPDCNDALRSSRAESDNSAAILVAYEPFRAVQRATNRTWLSPWHGVSRSHETRG